MSVQGFRDTEASGGVRWADSVAELAAATGIDPAGLEGTLTETRRYANGEAKDVRGRTFWGALLAGRVGAIAVRTALFRIQGELRVNGDACVLQESGDPIIGLYVSGGAAMGISGHGAAGYSAGNGLLPAPAWPFWRTNPSPGKLPDPEPSLGLSASEMWSLGRRVRCGCWCRVLTLRRTGLGSLRAGTGVSGGNPSVVVLDMAVVLGAAQGSAG